ncbi:hypothetical protein JCM30237_21940 [Halolamina litorea]|uniref:PrsW family glutamic-type intramembrane protease n=1 Tax=Halolamina litorea TaxID=1515593 RepID=A0ABD6BNX2_9EURY|nr:PrsW family glutamic-type intramembrane protease [Halolamina litorea]
MTDTDPVESATTDGRDLYDIATWEPRTVLDRAAVGLHSALAGGARLFVVLLAAFVFLAQIGGVVWLASRRPTLGAVALLSALPAFLLVAFVWRQDVVEKEPLDTLAITFVLSVLFASFAATANTYLQQWFGLIPVVGMTLFFFLVVAPVEETVKWLAIRLHAYRRPEFDAVIDGAVYGAVAGLGFATIENTLYVVRGFIEAQEAGVTQAIGAALGTATSRALAGPGHVIYSAWAGYYLGLAKFNRDNRGPIVVKGLLIAALIHGTYNTVVTYAPLSILPGWGYVVFVIAFDGFFFYLLYRKLKRYRLTYLDTVDEGSENDGTPEVETATESQDPESSSDPGPVWDAPNRTDGESSDDRRDGEFGNGESAGGEPGGDGTTDSEPADVAGPADDGTTDDESDVSAADDTGAGEASPDDGGETADRAGEEDGAGPN